MNNRSGLTFADVLILVALVLLLAALAIPRFVKAPDYGNEQDDLAADATNQAVTAEATPSEVGPKASSGGGERSQIQP